MNQQAVKWSAMESALFNDDFTQQLIAAQFFRKLLSQNLPVPISGMIHLVPRFVELLDNYDQPQIQFEVTWSLTNVAYGSTFETHQLNETGATKKLIELVQMARDSTVRDQAIWALSNIAGDCSNCRQFLLELGLLDLVIGFLTECVDKPSFSKEDTRRTAVWTLSNLCRNRQPDEFPFFEPILPLLSKLRLYCFNEKELMAEICWVLVYLTESDDSPLAISSVINNGFVELIIDILNESSTPAFIQSAIRAAGNIATGTDEQTQHLLNHGILPIIDRLLDHHKESLLREICWLISNITAGTVAQLELVLTQCPQMFCKLNRLIVGNQTVRVRKEASWSVCNALTGASSAQLHQIVQAGSIHALCSTLYLKQDEKLLSAILSSLEHVLMVGREEAENILGDNVYAILMEDCGGLANVVALQHHPSALISYKCLDMLSEHFDPSEKRRFDSTAEQRQMPIRIIFNR